MELYLKDLFFKVLYQPVVTGLIHPKLTYKPLRPSSFLSVLRWLSGCESKGRGVCWSVWEVEGGMWLIAHVTYHGQHVSQGGTKVGGKQC